MEYKYILHVTYSLIPCNASLYRLRNHCSTQIVVWSGSLSVVNILGRLQNMSGVGNKVFEEALSLPSDERVSLVEKLLTSLNLPIQEEIDQWWAEEAERRVSQIEQGEVELIPGNEVFAKIRRKYKR